VAHLGRYSEPLFENMMKNKGPYFVDGAWYVIEHEI
jgi:hypothetical protein